MEAHGSHGTELSTLSLRERVHRRAELESVEPFYSVVRSRQLAGRTILQRFKRLRGQGIATGIFPIR